MRSYETMRRLAKFCLPVVAVILIAGLCCLGQDVVDSFASLETQSESIAKPESEQAESVDNGKGLGSEAATPEVVNETALGVSPGPEIKAVNDAGVNAPREVQAEVETGANKAIAVVLLNSLNFPDPVFLEYAKAQIDKNGDGVLREDETLAVLELNLEGMQIHDLKGIAHFGALQRLNANGLGLTEVDLSSNIALAQLYLDDNHLTSLDLSQNTQLVDFTASGNTYHSDEMKINTGRLPGKFDVGKVTNIKAATLDKKNLVADGSGPVTYTYATGNPTFATVDFMITAPEMAEPAVPTGVEDDVVAYFGLVVVGLLGLMIMFYLHKTRLFKPR